MLRCGHGREEGAPWPDFAGNQNELWSLGALLVRLL